MISRRPTPAPTPTIVDGDRRRLGPAWHRRVRGLSVLKVKGSFREMGRQHGALLAAEIPRGPIPYFRQHAERLLGRSVGPLAPVLFAGLRGIVGRRVAARLPDFARETALGVAEGAGMPVEPFLDGCVMPDALLWAVSRYIELTGPGPAVAHRVSLGMGCTSAIAWGDATTDGKLLHARNFDYHGVDVWPGTAAVVFHEPDDGQRYVSIAAAGVALGGVTAMNAAGLSLTVHQHMFTAESRLGGTPIGTVGDIIMRQARSLDDAQRILAAHRPIGCWTYLVTDGKRREVLCWEESPARQAPRRTGPGDDTFAYANVFLDGVLGATESDLYGSYWRNNGARLRIARERLLRRAGPLDPAALAAILADEGEPRCRVADAVAQVVTVASVVFKPEDGLVWVATGEAPTSKNAFVPFTLDGEDHAAGVAEIPARPRGAGDEAFASYRQGYVAYLDERDLPAARRHLDRARRLAPEQAVYHAVAGFVALEDGDAAAAERLLDEALHLGHPHPERLSGFHLWRGRARDLLGKREAAREDYRAVLGRPADAAAREQALKSLKRPYHKVRMSVDFVLGDVTA